MLLELSEEVITGVSQMYYCNDSIQGQFERLARLYKIMLFHRRRNGHPQAQEPEPAKERIELQKKTEFLFRTGINPGLMMDLLGNCINWKMY